MMISRPEIFTLECFEAETVVICKELPLQFGSAFLDFFTFIHSNLLENERFVRNVLNVIRNINILASQFYHNT